eukprot:7001894-Prorocentrum_lima.AAC.1
MVRRGDVSVQQWSYVLGRLIHQFNAQAPNAGVEDLMQHGQRALCLRVEHGVSTAHVRQDQMIFPFHVAQVHP